MLEKNDLYEFLQRRWKERGIEYKKGERMGIDINELINYSAEKNKNTLAPIMDTWIVILDEFVSWLISLSSIYCTHRKHRNSNGSTDFDRSIVMLLAKITGDTLAIRNLILSGFNASAYTLLRSTAEYMEVYVAILHDPSLCKDFVRGKTPDEAKKFWENYLRGKKIRKRINDAWLEFFQSENTKVDKDAKWFSEWGDSSRTKLSSIIHPSFAGGMITNFPPELLEEDDPKFTNEVQHCRKVLRWDRAMYKSPTMSGV